MPQISVMYDLDLFQKQPPTISVEQEGKIRSLEIYVFFTLTTVKKIKMYANLNFIVKALTPTAYLNHR